MDERTEKERGRRRCELSACFSSCYRHCFSRYIRSSNAPLIRSSRLDRIVVAPWFGSRPHAPQKWHSDDSRGNVGNGVCGLWRTSNASKSLEQTISTSLASYERIWTELACKSVRRRDVTALLSRPFLNIDRGHSGEPTRSSLKYPSN